MYINVIKLYNLQLFYSYVIYIFILLVFLQKSANSAFFNYLANFIKYNAIIFY